MPWDSARSDHAKEIRHDEKHENGTGVVCGDARHGHRGTGGLSTSGAVGKPRFLEQCAWQAAGRRDWRAQWSGTVYLTTHAQRHVIRCLSDRGRRAIAAGSAPRTPVPGEPGEFISHVDLTIVGGFGKYAEATGTMTFDGVSHTGTVPRTADLIYKGTVCGPMSKGTRTNRSRRSIFRSMGGSDVILFGDRCARPSYRSQRQPRFRTKTGLKSSISGPSVRIPRRRARIFLVDVAGLP